VWAKSENQVIILPIKKRIITELFIAW